MPNMTSKPRRNPTAKQINPYGKGGEYSDSGRVHLRRGDPVATAILDAWAAKSRKE